MKYLKKEWNKKDGKGNKDFKGENGGGRGLGGKLGQGVGVLKKGEGGLEPPYKLWLP